jgi:hypothetical protein
MEKPHIVHSLTVFTALVRQVNALGADPSQLELFGSATIITIPSRCIKRVRYFSEMIVRHGNLLTPSTVRHCLLVCAKLMCLLFSETRIAKRYTHTIHYYFIIYPI